jgi:hypothetical protein
MSVREKHHSGIRSDGFQLCESATEALKPPNCEDVARPFVRAARLCAPSTGERLHEPRHRLGAYSNLHCH